LDKNETNKYLDYRALTGNPNLELIFPTICNHVNLLENYILYIVDVLHAEVAEYNIDKYREKLEGHVTLITDNHQKLVKLAELIGAEVHEQPK
jgi:hypothetical protein